MPPPVLDARLREHLVRLIAKGDEVTATHRPPPPDTFGFPTLAPDSFKGWRAQGESLLTNLLGKDHVYTKHFGKEVESGFIEDVRSGQGILKAVVEDLDAGLLRDVKQLVAAEVFTDLLDMAGHLLEAGYKDACASLTGAVLENGLRRVVASAGFVVTARDSLNSLNDKCASGGLYTRLVQKRLQVWIDIRNSADHGQFDQYTTDDVREMVGGVTEVLGQHLS